MNTLSQNDQQSGNEETVLGDIEALKKQQSETEKRLEALQQSFDQCAKIVQAQLAFQLMSMQGVQVQSSEIQTLLSGFVKDDSLLNSFKQLVDGAGAAAENKKPVEPASEKAAETAQTTKEERASVEELSNTLTTKVASPATAAAENAGTADIDSLAAAAFDAELLKKFEESRDEEAKKLLDQAEQARPAEQLDAATERLLSLEAKGLPFTIEIDTQSTVEQPFSEMFMQDGNRLFEAGKYAEAEKHYNATLPMMEEILGREHLAVVDVIHKLALIAIKRAKYEQAEQTFQQTLTRRVMALGDKHPDSISTVNALGELYLRQGRYQEARKNLTDALDARRQVHGNEHKATADSCHQLGLLYLMQGGYRDAALMMEKAFEIRKKVFGDEHVDSTESKFDLARLCLVMNRLPLAEKLLRQVLESRKRSLGEDHPDVALTQILYAEYLSKVGRYEEALQLSEQAFGVIRKSMGERHPDTAASLHQLGLMQAIMKDYDSAKRNLSQALYIRKTTLGEDHPESLASTHEFGMLCWKRGVSGDAPQLEEALPLLSKAFSARRKMLGEKHVDTLQSMLCLANALLWQGKVNDAEVVLRLLYKNSKEIFGRNHLLIADSAHALALCLIKKGQKEEAAGLLEEENSIRSALLGAENKIVLRALAENESLLQQAGS